VTVGSEKSLEGWLAIEPLRDSSLRCAPFRMTSESPEYKKKLVLSGNGIDPNLDIDN
jgi:hypothetical protein